MASLCHYDEAQAALINCLLRSYISYNLYNQADKLISTTTFPKLEFDNSPSPIHISPSLQDIYVKLHLGLEEDAEYIVGKAI